MTRKARKRESESDREGEDRREEGERRETARQGEGTARDSDRERGETGRGEGTRIRSYLEPGQRKIVGFVNERVLQVAGHFVQNPQQVH